MLILIILTFIIALITYITLRRRVQKKSVLITGPKSTGKTILINQILNKTNKTVPTLSNYSIITPHYELSENRHIPDNIRYNLIIYMFKNKIEKQIHNKNMIYCSLDKENDINKEYFKNLKIPSDKIFFLDNQLNKIKNIIQNNL